MSRSLKRFRGEFMRCRHLMSRINWVVPSFSSEKAYVCAVFSKLAYLIIPEAEAKYAPSVKIIPCFTYQQLIAQGNTDALAEFWASLEIGEPIIIVSDNLIIVGVCLKDVIIVAIRGTRLLYVSDWMTDFNVRRLRVYPDGINVVYHRGFYLSITEKLESLTQAIRKRVGNTDIPTYVTGHSLGGAMAGILFGLGGRTFASRYQFETPRKRVINLHSSLTFGMPRYGNWNAVSELNSPFHVYNQHDVVPSVPPRVLGFADVPVEYKAHTGAPLKETPRASIGVTGTWARIRNARGARHHFIELYIRRIGSGIGL